VLGQARNNPKDARLYVASRYEWQAATSGKPLRIGESRQVILPAQYQKSNES